MPQALADRWKNYRQLLPTIHSINVPRWPGHHNSHTHQLHGFYDSSEAAYAAMVYFRSLNTKGKIWVNIVTARTKVAPVKRVSLSRLKPWGVVLLSRRISYFKSTLKQPDLVA